MWHKSINTKGYLMMQTVSVRLGEEVNLISDQIPL